jgi:hypothetical protein
MTSDEFEHYIRERWGEMTRLLGQGWTNHHYGAQETVGAALRDALDCPDQASGNALLAALRQAHGLPWEWTHPLTSRLRKLFGWRVEARVDGATLCLGWTDDPNLGFATIHGTRGDGCRVPSSGWHVVESRPWAGDLESGLDLWLVCDEAIRELRPPHPERRGSVR